MNREFTRHLTYKLTVSKVCVNFLGWFADKKKTWFLTVATPAEPRGEKKLFFVQILGGEKLLKFVEKCR